jgi:hypothetical protein
MRHLIRAATIVVSLSAPALAQAPEGQLMAPIQKFTDSFNKGDVSAAKATHLSDADLTIVDEVPPFIWRGADAFTAWAAALQADAKAHGETDQMVTLGKMTRSETSGDRAYVVVPAVYSFKRGGTAMREAAQMTFTLKKSGEGWLIHSWTWTGPRPTPSAAAR